VKIQTFVQLEVVWRPCWPVAGMTRLLSLYLFVKFSLFICFRIHYKICSSEMFGFFSFSVFLKTEKLRIITFSEICMAGKAFFVPLKAQLHEEIFPATFNATGLRDKSRTKLLV